MTKNREREREIDITKTKKRKEKRSRNPRQSERRGLRGSPPFYKVFPIKQIVRERFLRLIFPFSFEKKNCLIFEVIVT